MAGDVRPASELKQRLSYERVPAGEKWRVLPADGGSSERHVAQSNALSRLVVTPTVWWHWTEVPAIILGAGQVGADVDAEACAKAGIRVTKRSSGGATVYAGRALIGLDVALPAGHHLIQADVVESYRWLGEIWVRALDELGVRGQLVSIDEARRRPPPSPSAAGILRIACFGSISPYEVLFGGRKLVGLSQVRRGGRALFQSGLYLDFEADALSRLLLIPDRVTAAHQLEEVATGLHSAIGRDVARDEVIDAFSTALCDRLNVVGVAGDWTVEELECTNMVEMY